MTVHRFFSIGRRSITLIIIITPISVVVVKKREVIFTKEGHGLLSYNDDSGSGDQREPAGVDAGKWQIDIMLWW